MKVEETYSPDGKTLNGYLFECPGCGFAHVFDHRWQFNQDFESPTFSPSLLVRGHDGSVCHSYVRSGKIQFLGDCTHEKAGQTLELNDID
jgi:hypothetical protein